MSTPLDDWMTAKGWTNLALADALAGLPDRHAAQISKETLRMVRRGQRLPSRNLMRALYFVSDGAIDANSFYDLSANTRRRNGDQGDHATPLANEGDDDATAGAQAKAAKGDNPETLASERPRPPRGGMRR